MNVPADEDLMAAIVAAFPGFKPAWEIHLSNWRGEPAGLHNDMMELAVYVQELMAGDGAEEMARILAYAETVMQGGSETAKDAVATSFLETVVNGLEPGAPSTAAFVEALGPESLAFCKAWNTFSGGGLPEIESAGS